MWLDSDIRSRVSCRLAKGEVCARWTYVYNNECKKPNSAAKNKLFLIEDHQRSISNQSIPSH